jgi:hypothetical protein
MGDHVEGCVSMAPYKWALQLQKAVRNKNSDVSVCLVPSLGHEEVEADPPQNQWKANTNQSFGYPVLIGYLYVLRHICEMCSVTADKWLLFRSRIVQPASPARHQKRTGHIATPHIHIRVRLKTWDILWPLDRSCLQYTRTEILSWI